MKFYFNTHTKEIYTEAQHDQMKEKYISENLRNMPIDQWAYDQLYEVDPFDEWNESTRESIKNSFASDILEDMIDKLSEAFEQDYCLLLSEKPVKVVKERG